MAFDHTCLVSRIKNTSGNRMRFPFLPSHGMTLDEGEEVEIEGDIFEAVTRRPGQSGRNLAGLLAALDDSDLTILSRPAPILLDDTTEATKALRLNNGSLGVEDVCWDTSLSE